MRVYGWCKNVDPQENVRVYEGEDKIATLLGKRLAIVPGGRFDWKWDAPDHWVTLEVQTAFGKLFTPAFHTSKEQHLRFDSLRGAIVQDPSSPPGPDHPPVLPGLAKQFTAGTFTRSVSAYGLLGAPRDRIERTLASFADHGFASVRVWVDWDRVPGCRAFDPKGKVIQAVADVCSRALDFAAAKGVSFDLTMETAHYESTKRSEEGYDISCHKAALKSLLTFWGKHPALRIVDADNEAETRKASPGSGSPEGGHTSPGRFNELMIVARAVQHSCLVSASISSGGDEHDVNLAYQHLFRDTWGDVLLPHFPRVSGWGSNEGTNANALRKAVPGLAVHHQEPARNGYNGQNWPVSEFEASFKTAKASGSVGCCFHTEAGFDLTQKDFVDQLDGVESQVYEKAATWT